MGEVIFHDWPAGECTWETQGCEQPEDETWWVTYIQTAIDTYGAEPCPVCLPGDRSNRIAYDVRMRSDDGKTKPRRRRGQGR